MRRGIGAGLLALWLVSLRALAEPPCSTVYSNKPCDAPVQWDPPSKTDTYIKSQYGQHIGNGPANPHIGASVGHGYHQVIWHHHTAASQGSSGSTGAKAKTTHRPSASK
jgi:hypothetical protein